MNKGFRLHTRASLTSICKGRTHSIQLLLQYKRKPNRCLCELLSRNLLGLLLIPRGQAEHVNRPAWIRPSEVRRELKAGLLRRLREIVGHPFREFERLPCPLIRIVGLPTRLG